MTLQQYRWRRTRGLNNAFDFSLPQYTEPTFDEFFDDDIRLAIAIKLRDVFRSIGQFNFSIRVLGVYENSEKPEEQPYYQNVYSTISLLTRDTNFVVLLNEILDEMREAMKDPKFDKYQLKLVRILDLRLEINKYRPLQGRGWLDLPTWIKNKKCIRNIKTPDDDLCFKYAIIFALFAEQKYTTFDRYMKAYHENMNIVSFDGLTFPVDFEQIKIFEENNETRITVFGENDFEQTIDVLYRPSNMSYEKHIELFLIEHGERSHFCFVSRYSALINNSNSQKDHFCTRCFQSYTKPELAAKCEIMCQQSSDTFFTPRQCFTTPDEGTELYFTNIQNQLVHPFVVYCDLESIIRLMEGENDKNMKEHIANGYSLVLVSRAKPELNKVTVCQGLDSVYKMILELVEIYELYNYYLENPQPMEITEEEKKAFKVAKFCHICGKKKHFNRIIEEYIPFVKDHCHVTKKYRGPAHNNCNLKYKMGKKMPIFFHNFKGYDSNFIIKEIHKFEHMKKSLLGREGNIISLDLDYLNFKDSFMILPESLDTLAKSIPEEALVLSKQFFGEELHPFIRKKLPYCYSYITSMDVYNETDCPSRQSFYDDLNEKECSEEDYQLVLDVWKTAKCQNLGEFAAIYSKLDVLLLADIFEHFRTTLLAFNGLDCAHYYSASGIAYDSALKSGVKVELMSELEDYEFVESSIVGALCGTALRYAEANNKDMGDEYDPSKPDSYLMYLDINNMYGRAMMEYLPSGEFDIIDGDEYEVEEILEMEDEGEYGAIFEIDCEYPEELHVLHNDLPFVHRKMKITRDMLSKANSDYLKRTGTPMRSTECLVGTFYKKENVIMHYRELKQAIKYGLKVTKIHRALQFRQSPFLRDFIGGCVIQRRNSEKGSFQQKFWKLMINSLYGKLIENVRKYTDFRFAQTDFYAEKYGSKRNIKCRTIYDENLVGYEIYKSNVKLNKPIFAGSAVLGISKTYLYDFFYGVIKELYGNKARLMYYDTDSMILHIQTDDVYADLKENSSFFDFSSLPKDHRAYSDENRMIPGKWKDETGGRIIKSVAALCAKRYIIEYMDGSNHTRVAGVKGSTVAKLKMDDFKNAMNGEVLPLTSNYIRSKDHNVYNITETRKNGLGEIDIKRYVYKNGLDSLAYGSKFIQM